MKTFIEIAHFYQGRFGLKKDYKVISQPSPDLKVVVVIPCYNEDLQHTLDSLAHNRPEVSRHFEVLLVINHSEGESPEIKKKHEQQALEFSNVELENGLSVYGIKAFDLPQKHAGVGLARKIGMDVALQRLASINHDGLIVCLDADCTVSPDYLPALEKVEEEAINGLAVYFEHPLGFIAEEHNRKQIIDYEIYLRYYIQALRYSGYFHAFHTIGSSMAVRASVYARIGGMNRRKAGEDFYFLHKLIPQGRFYDMPQGKVFPSARISERVPFGTGKAMLQMQRMEKDFSQAYHYSIFADLKQWLDMGPSLANNEEAWPEMVKSFFTAENQWEEWEALKRRSKGEQQFWRNFSHWLDGFKVLKLVHYGRDHFYGNASMMENLHALFQFSEKDSEQALMALRTLDRESGFRYFYHT